MILPPWLDGVLVPMRYCVGNSGRVHDDEILLRNAGTSFVGTYTAHGVAGTIAGIAVGPHPAGGVVVAFSWSEPGWQGEECLHYWQTGTSIEAWGSFTSERLSGARAGRCSVGQEYTR